MLYAAVLFTSDPILRQWAAQNFLPSPNPVLYLLGYVALLIPAIFGWRALAHRSPTRARFIGAWSLVAPLLLYLPVGPQRRLIEGFQLPLVILAAWGLTTALRRWRMWLPPLTAAVSLPTTALLLIFGLTSGGRLAEPIFHPADELAAFNWLDQNAAAGQVALSAYETGNALPAYTSLVAYIGHGPETVFLAEKAPRAAAFYQSAATDGERKQLLADGRIAFVIFGPHERALGSFEPDSATYLRRVFSSGQYRIYELIP